MCAQIIPFPEAIEGTTGEPVRAPGTEEVFKVLSGLKLGSGRRRGVTGNVDPTNLAEAGWGIIFPESAGQAVELRQALGKLLDFRRAKAGELYREYLGSDGYRTGESKLDFLGRKGAGPGRVNPKVVPYYLLIVGSPEEIPYRFQYDLDLQHAVGRIHFGTIEEYKRYAEAVVAAEEGDGQVSRRVALFGPRHDEGTILSTEALLAPLAERLRRGGQVDEYIGESATKANLARLVGGEATPNLIFTAGHGLMFQAEEPAQRCYQGALVCQDWPGYGYGPPAPEHVFSAIDVNAGARLRGLMAFLFACFSAGTPDRSDFEHDGTAGAMAPKPFIANLAQRLLAGGALAVVGHVERVWRCSFLWRETGSQISPFAETVERLLFGGPLGWALESLNERYADLAASLLALLEDEDLRLPANQEALAELRTASRDARNYVVVGDPAVRLPVAAKAEPETNRRVRRSVAE